MPVQRLPRQPGLDPAKPVRYRRLPVPDVSTGGGGGPTFIITDVIGFKDAETWAWNLPDAIGLKDEAATWGLNLTDKIGLIDALALTGTPVFSDVIGFKDSMLLASQEAALIPTGSPDADAWGDAWVDRTVGQTGVNHSTGSMTVSAVTAVTQQDGYSKINFGRYVSLTADSAQTSTFTVQILWPTVALAPNSTMQVDMRSNAASPFTESTITAANKARFTSSAPYTQRTFTFPQDNTVHACTISFTTAEVNDFLGRWLELQYTLPNLTVGVHTVASRRDSSSLATYSLKAREA